MSTDTAIARRSFRQVRVSAVVWALVFAVMVASTAATYASSFPDVASRRQLAATTGTDTGLAILLGPISGIDTVGGYTVYKVFVFLTTIGALWALLATTRLLRGEEDAGRWALLLAGSTRPPRATGAVVGALLVAVGVVFIGATAGAILAGLDPDVGFGVGESLVYGLSLAVAPAVFVAIGALTAQLGRTRAMANGLGMAAFGLSFALRMVADSGPGTRWLLWCTPFGWVERMRPFTADDLRPALVAGVAGTALVITALRLSDRRDVGSGILSPHDVTPLRPFGLGSPLGLMTRLGAPVLAAWCAGAVASGLAFGIIAKVATGQVPESISDNLADFGVQGTFLRQFFGVAFLMVATIVALISTSPLGAAAEDESSGRLAHVLAQPVGRRSVIVGRVALAAAAIAVAGALAGLAAWLGAWSQGVHAGLGRTVLAGANVVPTALLVLAFGALVLAVAPRWATRAVYAVVIGSLLVDMVSSLVEGLDGLGRLSVFHYMALAPAEDPEPMTVGLTLTLALVLAVIAVLRFERRDLATG